MYKLRILKKKTFFLEELFKDINRNVNAVGENDYNWKIPHHVVSC